MGLTHRKQRQGRKKTVKTRSFSPLHILLGWMIRGKVLDDQRCAGPLPGAPPYNDMHDRDFQDLIFFSDSVQNSSILSTQTKGNIHSRVNFFIQLIMLVLIKNVCLNQIV